METSLNSMWLRDKNGSRCYGSVEHMWRAMDSSSSAAIASVERGCEFAARVYAEMVGDWRYWRISL